MITKLKYYIEQSTDPIHNLAVEKALCDGVDSGECIIYLWQNDNTVVIGHNQNAWKECRIDALKADGGRIVRRLSGGGAVYHDMGNLNFTFCTGKEDHDPKFQMKIIADALELLGVETQFSGRNDVLFGGRKVCGSSYYIYGDKAFCNGCILIDANTDKMHKYLSPSKYKLQGKGVDSVKSRVHNLISMGVSVQKLKYAIIDACNRSYGLVAEEMEFTENAAFDQALAFFGSEKWILGQTKAFTYTIENKFPWGNAQINIMVDGGICSDVQVFTDSMNPHMDEIIIETIKGRQFSENCIEKTLQSLEGDTIG